MAKFRKKTGKHFVKNPDGSLKKYLPGDIIECEPEFLGSALDTFEKLEEPPVPQQEEPKLITIGVAEETKQEELVEVKIPTKEKKPKKKSKFSKG